MAFIYPNDPAVRVRIETLFFRVITVFGHAVEPLPGGIPWLGVDHREWKKGFHKVSVSGKAARRPPFWLIVDKPGGLLLTLGDGLGYGNQDGGHDFGFIELVGNLII